jgi:chromatin remodeling complex protein RSC6
VWQKKVVINKSQDQTLARFSQESGRLKRKKIDQKRKQKKQKKQEREKKSEKREDNENQNKKRNKEDFTVYLFHWQDG